MSTVFISYRREITAGEARALFNELLAKLGKSGSISRRVLLAGSTGLVAAAGLAVRSALAQGTPTPGMPAVQAPVRQDWLDKRHEEIAANELGLAQRLELLRPAGAIHLASLLVTGGADVVAAADIRCLSPQL